MNYSIVQPLSDEANAYLCKGHQVHCLICLVVGHRALAAREELLKSLWEHGFTVENRSTLHRYRHKRSGGTYGWRQDGFPSFGSGPNWFSRS
jgi:hypothetical protein